MKGSCEAGQKEFGFYGRTDSYRSRQPDQTVLYKVLAGHLETFLARQKEQERHVPRFVEDELRAFLECGIPAYGFLRVHCDACGKDKLVAFSCKGRGFCPSCCGRRMADTAAHLVDRVIPHVPVRQWVLSLPYALRYRLAYDSGLVTAVLGVFVRAVFGHLKRKARENGIELAQCGAVTFVQRFGSALNLNVHFHMAALDGVYAPSPGGDPEFFPLRAPETSDIRDVVETLARRIPALLKRGRGKLPLDAEDSDDLVREAPWLAAVYAASVTGRIATGAQAGGRVARGGDRVDPEGTDWASSPRCARESGFSLHANVAVPSSDRSRLERLLRYMARPPLATERLEVLPDGRLVYGFKQAWRDGTSQVVWEPLTFIEKLVPLVPKPRVHMTRYSGVLAPAAKWRKSIVPGGWSEAAAATPSTETAVTAVPAGTVPGCADPMPSAERHPRNYGWAELMRRVFEFDVLSCECGGRLRILSAIHPPDTTRKILDCMGMPSRPPPIAPAAAQLDSD